MSQLKGFPLVKCSLGMPNDWRKKQLRTDNFEVFLKLQYIIRQ